MPAGGSTRLETSRPTELDDHSPTTAPGGAPAPARRRHPLLARGWRGLVPTTAMGLLVLVVALLFVFPTVMVVVGAFRTSSPGFPGEWSVQPLLDAYAAGETWELLWNSTFYSISVTTLSLALAVFFAWMVTQTNTPGRQFVTPLMVTLITLPFLFFGISWAMLGNERSGLLNQLIQMVVPVEEGPINIRSWGGIIGVATLKITAINYILMLGVFRTLDPALREASQMAGVSRGRTFFRIELPMLAPVLLALALMGFVKGLESFDVPLLLGSPAGIEVFSTAIYDYLTNNFPPAYAQASALALLVMAIMAVLVVLMWRFMGKRDFTTVGGKGQRVEPIDLKGWKYACTAAIALYALVALAFPLVQLVLGSLQPVFGLLTFDLTVEHYRTVLGDSDVVSALWNTAFIVLVGGFLALTLAVLVAYLVQRTRSRARWFLEGATWLPWGLPGIVLALGMIWAYLSVPLFRQLFATIWMVMLGLIVVSTPIAVRLSNAAISQVHVQLEEAARIHGASRLRAAVGIVLRLILPSLLAGWLIVGVIMAGDLAVPAMLSGPRSQTVPVVLLQLLESGNSSEAAAVFCVMLGAIAIAMAAIYGLRLLGTRLLSHGDVSEPESTDDDEEQMLPDSALEPVPAPALVHPRSEGV